MMPFGTLNANDLVNDWMNFHRVDSMSSSRNEFFRPL